VKAEELSSRLLGYWPELSDLCSIEKNRMLIKVRSETVHATISKLKELGFNQFEMVTAVDRGADLEIIYVLHSIPMKASVWVRTHVPRDAAEVASMADLYTGADWPEREVYDLFGIDFIDHPDMRRIMMPFDFVGAPLRKDYVDENIIPRPDYI